MTRTDKRNSNEVETQGNGQRSRLVEALQAWMIVRLSEELKVPPAEIDTRKPLLDYGLDSVIAFLLTGELADRLGQELSTTLFWDFPTLEALAVYLADEIKGGAAAESMLTELNNALSVVEKPPVDETLQSDKRQR